MLCKEVSEVKFSVIIRYFAHDLPASKIAALSDVSRPTINQLLMKVRIRIAQVCESSPPLSGEVEVDESYFGARRVRGKKGRGAADNGKVYTKIASKKQLQRAIRG